MTQAVEGLHTQEFTLQIFAEITKGEAFTYQNVGSDMRSVDC